MSDVGVKRRKISSVADKEQIKLGTVASQELGYFQSA